MKRKCLSLMLALAAILTLALPASADVIWTPDDDFYESHYEACTYVNRQYELAGHDGTVTVCDAPGGTVVETVPNGQRGWVQFVWSGDGVDWGYLYAYSDSDDVLENMERGGWVPMDDLSLIYDCQQFMEDHQAEIASTEVLALDFDTAVLYDYPGGPVNTTLRENPNYTFSEAISSTYTDENGLRWGHISYYFHMEGWVCLDDPMNEHLDTNIVPVAPSAAQLRDSATVTPGGGQHSQLILAGVLVAAVVVVTAVIILKLHPKKKSEE